MGALCSKEDGARRKNFLVEQLDDHSGGINCTALSDDGSVLATGSEDMTARLWTTKTETCECIGIMKGHDDYINCIAIEDSYVLTGSADKSIRKWEMSTCECVQVFDGHSSLINRIICTGDFVFSTSYDRTARCWDFDTGECVRIFSGHKRGVYPVVFIPADDEEINPETFDWDGNKDLLITGSADFTARSWSFETGRPLRIFSGHTGAITCMATDPLGRILFTGSTDNTIRSWNIEKGEALKVFEGHQGSIICMLVVNRILFTGSSDHTARSWVSEFGDCTRVYKGHKHTVSGLKYNQGILYTCSGDGNSMAFDSKSGTLKRTFTGHQYSINSIQLVEGRLFTGSHDCSLGVWDASGIKEDNLFGKDENKGDETSRTDKNANNKDTRIHIDDDDGDRDPGDSQKNSYATGYKY